MPAIPASKKLALIIICVVALAVTHRILFGTSRKSRSSVSIRRRIDGRWNDVRSSLFLPPLPENVIFPAPPAASPYFASRLDLRRKRSVDSYRVPQLHFAADALHEPSASLAELAASFRAIALAEKEDAEERARSKGEKQGQSSRRRPSSWTTRRGKGSQ